MQRLPQVHGFVKEGHPSGFYTYLYELCRADIHYPCDFITDLHSILSHSAGLGVKKADRWRTGVVTSFEQDPHHIALMVAKDVVTQSQGKRTGHILASSLSSSEGPDCVNQHIHRLLEEWQTRGDFNPIIHEHRFSAILLLSSKLSCLLGEIPIPQTSHDLYWGTTFSNTTDTVAYKGVFLDGGIVSRSMWLYGGDGYFFQMFGVSLWLIWPPLEENLRVLPGNSRRLEWCLENLNGLLVCTFVSSPPYCYCGDAKCSGPPSTGVLHAN